MSNNVEEMLIFEYEYQKPANWVEVTLGEVVSINPSKPKLNYSDDCKISFLPMSSVDPVTGQIIILEEREFSKVKKGYTYFQENDILFAKITPCMENGNTVIANGLLNKFGFGSTEFYVLRPSKIIDVRFIYYLIRSEKFRKEAKAVMSGAVGHQRVPKSFLINHTLFLPPLNEQKRIANKIESLFSKIDEAKHLIDEVKKTFEVRWAAILEKAFQGELTKKWRESNQNIEPPIVRYENIKKERISCVENSREQKEIMSLYNQYEVDGINIDDKGWLYLKANMFCHNINCGGTPTGYINEIGDIPFLKVYNIVKNRLDFSANRQYIPFEINSGKLNKSRLLPNDVIMNIVGPPLKKIAIITSEFPEWNMNQAIVRFRALKSVMPKYIYYCLQYDKTLENIMVQTRGVVGQVNISVNQSRNIVMPIPSLAEQKELVNILDSIYINEENAIFNLEQKLVKVKQSILQKAFRGELGTNDPTEESALELLKEKHFNLI